MNLRRFVPFLLVIALVAISAPASFVSAAATREVAIVNISGPLEVQRQLLSGQYVFEHDASRMARGEPCTTIYEFTPNGLGRKVLSFHCIPRQTGASAGTFTMTVRRSVDAPPKLVGYQFAGDTEDHGIPQK